MSDCCNRYGARNNVFALIVVITTFFTALWGWRKGLFLMALHLLALLLAYAVAIHGTLPLANILAQKGWLNGLLAVPLAGGALLLLGTTLFSNAAKRLAKAAPDEWSKKGGSGALAGAVLGFGVGLLGVWTVGALQDAWQWRAAQLSLHDTTPEQPSLPLAASPSPLDAALRRAAGDLMADSMTMALGNSAAAPVAAQWVREPLSVGLALKHAAEQPALRSLFTEPSQYAVLLRGDVADIQQLQGFRLLMADPQAMQLLQVAGLQGATPAERSAALAAMLTKYAQRFEVLRANPEFQALAADQSLHQRVQQGNWLALLADKRIRRLVTMLASEESQPAPTSPQKADHAAEGMDIPVRRSASAPTPEPAKSLYRWKDANGHLHITDQAPPEGIQADAIRP